jgi:hypothetical protein
MIKNRLLLLSILTTIILTSGCAVAHFRQDDKGNSSAYIVSLFGGRAKAGDKEIEMKHPLGLENLLSFGTKK